MGKIPVGILGPTGAVGQRFVQLLADHPWFEVTALASSDRSAGRQYGEMCHWLLPTPMPDAVSRFTVQPLQPNLDCRLVFSALPSGVAGPVETSFARAGYAVCSNAADHRLDPDVPLLIPEVNADHTALLPAQRARRGWDGMMVTSANCSSTQLALALKPLHDQFGVRRVAVVTLQAASGAGYPGVPAMDILDNVIPHIAGEEEKMEREPRKLLGTIRDALISDAAMIVSAQCNRVPVREGHTECVSVAFADKADPGAVAAALGGFRCPPEVARLPSSVEYPVIVRIEADRPQPARDRDRGQGMAVSVGRVRPCPILDVKFVVLGHNTLRGAAMGAIHNAELLAAQGWVK